MVTLSNVTKVYKNKSSSYKALDDLSFHIDKAEFVAIVGESGSGKSTLLNILGTLDTKNEGNVVIDDCEVQKLSRKNLCEFRNKSIGFVFQNYNLIDDITVRKNLELVLSYGKIDFSKRRKLIENALDKVDMLSKINSYPNELSGGQKQRIAIARAIIQDPKLILADEPGGNLDPKNSLKITQLFKQMQDEGKTIIMVTHDMSKTGFTDRVIKIQNGHCIQDGMH